MKHSIFVAIWASLALHAATNPTFTSILGGAGQDYAGAVTTDAAGNTYVGGETYSPDFPVTPNAVQTKFGGTADAFVAKLGPDGKVIWATYLGGILEDSVTGIAVDSSGNVWVAGWTRSANFPLANPIQSTLDGNSSLDAYDAFVAKIDPTGSKLLYSTFFGGPGDDLAYGLAMDSGGNVYVTGTVQNAAGFPGFPSSATGSGSFVSKLNPQGAIVYSFFHPYGTASAIALDSTGSAYVTGAVYGANPSTAAAIFGPSGTQGAMVFKLSPDGTQKLYEVTLGGTVQTNGTAIAVDRTGAAYVGGFTTSVDFPLVNPLQSTLGARPLWKSTDSGATWTPFDNLPSIFPQAMVTDPTAPNTLYVTTQDAGIVKSTDGGATWGKINTGITGTGMKALAIDPAHPQTLYAASFQAGAVYKTVDGGGHWNAVDSITSSVLQLNVDAQNSANIYALWGSGLRKSTDGGATWSNVAFPGTSIAYLFVDPGASGNLYAFSNPFYGGSFSSDNVSPYLWHSTDGGTTWLKLNSPMPAEPPGVVFDASTKPSIVYDGFTSRSTDDGVTWTTLSGPPGSSAGVPAASAGTLYVATIGGGIYVSNDQGQTWTAIGSPVPASTATGNAMSVNRIISTAIASTLYALIPNTQTSGFVTKLSPDGSTIAFSTFLRGHVSLAPVVDTAAEPSIVWQNGINAIALDPAGDVVVAGSTRANDFPVANPLQAANAGRADAFVTTLAGDGSRLLYSTYLGGSQDDGALAISADAQGNLTFAGQTWSYDFPVPGGFQAQFGDAFVTKLAPPAAPAITAVLSAASYQPGIAAGSWVMIQGSGLANTNPGRTWATSDFNGANLPTALDGVSVTIDGKPAFVEYISPTQVNVLAPSDSATGAVSVVVDNNGALSAPAAAQYQAIAPAFFLYGATNYASASRFPDYAQVGIPSAPAHPGDTLVLWGSGFGPTNPPAPVGTIVSGAPALVTTPTVTVGGVQVPVVSAVMTTGTAGLYQLTVQLPASLPAGTLAVQASVGGVQTPTGVMLYVANQ